MTGGHGVAAGWYDDRRTAGVVRWFDGTAWTEHTRPVEPAPAQLVAFGQQPSGFGQAFGTGYPVYRGLVVDQHAIDTARRRVLRDFWFGVGFLLFGAVVAFWVSASLTAAGGYGGGRHYVSTAGVIGGLTSFYRARKSYKVMVSAGGQPWTPSRIMVSCLGGAAAVLLSAVAIVHAYTATGSPGMGPADAGSCWADGNGSVWQVSCDVSHTYRASGVITNGMSCPDPTDRLVALRDGSGNALCLAPDLAAAG